MIEGQRVDWPADGRVELDVALRSNELYPHRAGRHQRRAVRFVDADTLGYLIGLGAPPSLASRDITEPVRQADYALDFLPPDDAFYSFAGYLGERRALPGRPPAAAVARSTRATRSGACRTRAGRRIRGDAAPARPLSARFRARPVGALCHPRPTATARRRR